MISRILQTKKSKAWFTYNGETINARSIMGVLMLAAGKDAEINVKVEGDDAFETLKSLVEAFEDGFGEKIGA